MWPWQRRIICDNFSKTHFIFNTISTKIRMPRVVPTYERYKTRYRQAAATQEAYQEMETAYNVAQGGASPPGGLRDG
ncbi:hypothetical protein DESC_740157 [Desulfosarcina cetonica]|nr:hypothetical protein DESC_740157 [Desulfosarcina cetonica]